MLRTLLLNRFTLTLVAILVATLLWNIYVAANNDGIISGRVVDERGAPVAGAKVTVSGKTLALSEPIGTLTTDADGRFTFKDHKEYSLVLVARLEGRVSVNRVIRLWFKKQNITVKSPIVLPDQITR